MPNEMVFWSGKVKFNHLYDIDKFNRYSMQFYPDNAAYNEIMLLKKEGLQNTVKMDDDGYFVNLSRPPSVGPASKPVPLAPPEVYDKDGKLFRGSIGHNSDVIVKVEIRRYKKPNGQPGISARLTSVKIENLIEVEEKNDKFPQREMLF